MGQGIFASYHNLKSLVLPDTLANLSGWDRMNYARRLAAHNPSVTDLQFYKPKDVKVVNFHFRMGRGVDGRITAVVEALQNGMCCCGG